MATIKQRKAFNKIVENHGNVSRAMIEVGYDSTTAKNPKNLTESKGFQELCDEYGLTDDFLVKALVDDIRQKPKNRKAELELAFKVKNRLKEKPEGGNTFNQINVFNDEQLRRIATSFLDGDTGFEEKPSTVRNSDR